MGVMKRIHEYPVDSYYFGQPVSNFIANDYKDRIRVLINGFVRAVTSKKHRSHAPAIIRKVQVAMVDAACEMKEYHNDNWH